MTSSMRIQCSNALTYLCFCLQCSIHPLLMLLIINHLKRDMHPFQALGLIHHIIVIEVDK